MNKPDTQKITCKTCGKENVSDWKDGDCITCARDKILGSETRVGLQEIREQLDKIFTKLKFVEIGEDGSNVYQESKPFSSQLNEAVALFQQALTSLKSELVGLACPECRVRMEDKLNNGGTQHETS